MWLKTHNPHQRKVLWWGNTATGWQEPLAIGRNCMGINDNG